MTGQASSVSTVRSESGTYQATPLPVTFDCWWEYKDWIRGIRTRLDPEDRNDWSVRIMLTEDSSAGESYAGHEFLVGTTFAEWYMDANTVSGDEFSHAEFVNRGDFYEVFMEQVDRRGGADYHSDWNVGVGHNIVSWDMSSGYLNEANIAMRVISDGTIQYASFNTDWGYQEIDTDEDSIKFRIQHGSHFWQVLVDSTGAVVTNG